MLQSLLQRSDDDAADKESSSVVELELRSRAPPLNAAEGGFVPAPRIGERSATTSTDGWPADVFVVAVGLSLPSSLPRRFPGADEEEPLFGRPSPVPMFLLRFLGFFVLFFAIVRAPIQFLGSREDEPGRLLDGTLREASMSSLRFILTARTNSISLFQ
jgi:hypothetical protein